MSFSFENYIFDLEIAISELYIQFSIWNVNGFLNHVTEDR